MAKPSPSPDSAFISQSDAAADLGVSKVTLWRLIGRGDYPEPVAIPGSILKPIVRKEHENYKAQLMAARKNPARKAG
jgi:predicted DNA-binding transcriptional regulator AlpA